MNYVYLKERCVVVWTLNYKREDLGAPGTLVDHKISSLSDCAITIGQGKAYGQEHMDFSFCDWTEKDTVVLVKTVLGHQIQITQKLFENRFAGELGLVDWDSVF